MRVRVWMLGRASSVSRIVTSWWCGFLLFIEPYLKAAQSLRACRERPAESPRSQSVQNGREIAPARLLVLAHGHQGHWFDDPQPLGQAPAEETRLSARQEERDWLELIDAAPSMRASMSCSVSATPWFIIQKVAADR